MFRVKRRALMGQNAGAKRSTEDKETGELMAGLVPEARADLVT